MPAVEVKVIGSFPFLGYDQVQFAECDGLIYPLTPCCHASAKGCDGYVGCRRCYQELEPGFGACWTTDEWTGKP
jgi:hypothetical protein